MTLPELGVPLELEPVEVAPASLRLLMLNANDVRPEAVPGTTTITDA